MSRQLGAINKRTIQWLKPMSQQVPACYDQRTWLDYLRAVHIESLRDPALRASLTRGEAPDYCQDCTERYQVRMHAGGRCHPPLGAQSPLLPIELQSPSHEDDPA